ncbi:MAG: bifunctional diaminohydroxyphosphoribosylaminopyrimidine deaminase/5-amino-6-(5-phosphoribosylamino)uracil reductase RibD [Verrucomicrobiales bacterium]
MPVSQKELDCAHMRLALREARKAVGLTSPNPPVGCVIVKGGKVLARGYHRCAGGPHAEVEAMAGLTARALQGATAYVTLEPCSTHGQTPPCVDALEEAGIARVVYGSKDPNPEHNGRAGRILKRRGIKVEGGVLREPCDAVIRPWAKYISTGMPWVIAKAATSLDGRLTRPGKEGQWLSSEASRADAGRLRGEVDAILIGAATLRSDDPALTLRDRAVLKRGKGQPLRVVLSRSGRLPGKAQIFSDAHRAHTLVYRGRTLRAVLKDLALKHGCVSVMIEGGGKLLGDAFAKGLIDEACLYIAPIFCGAKGVPLVDAALPSSAQLLKPSVKRVGPDLRVRGLVNRV